MDAETNRVYGCSGTCLYSHSSIFSQHSSVSPLFITIVPQFVLLEHTEPTRVCNGRERGREQETDREAGRQTGRQAGRQTDRQRQTDCHKQTETEKQREREREIQPASRYMTNLTTHSGGTHIYALSHQKRWLPCGRRRKQRHQFCDLGYLSVWEVVALETAKTGVTCNAVCPGWVETPREYPLFGRFYQAIYIYI